jgi:hypothetical protein
MLLILYLSLAVLFKKNNVYHQPEWSSKYKTGVKVDSRGKNTSLLEYSLRVSFSLARKNIRTHYLITP